MEFISSLQLQKYEAVLSEIDEAFKAHEELKKQVEKETGKLIAARVATEESFAKDNVFKVIVKVFNSLFDVFYLYGEEIAGSEYEALRLLKNRKFYLVELYVSKLFQQKIASQSWLLNVNISNSHMCVCKTVTLKRKQFSSHVLVVVPFELSTEMAVVETKLLMSFGNFCSPLRLTPVIIDASYHFEPYKTDLPLSPVIKIAQNYSNDVTANLLMTPKSEYSFKCKCGVKHFFESTIKNCYHLMKPETIAAFTTKNASVIAVQFTVSDEVHIKLDSTEHSLTLSGSLRDLDAIKRYFIKELTCHEVVLDKAWHVSILNMKQYLRGELVQREVNPDNLKIIYKGLSKLVFDLVV